MMEWGTLLLQRLYLLLFEPDIEKPKPSAAASTSGATELLDDDPLPISLPKRRSEDPSLRLVLPMFIARNVRTVALRPFNGWLPPVHRETGREGSQANSTLSFLSSSEQFYTALSQLLLRKASELLPG